MFPGSRGSGADGTPVDTAQKRQDLVQISPRIRKVILPPA
jgi:hypothetical protein